MTAEKPGRRSLELIICKRRRLDQNDTPTCADAIRRRIDVTIVGPYPYLRYFDEEYHLARVGIGVVVFAVLAYLGRFAWERRFPPVGRPN